MSGATTFAVLLALVIGGPLEALSFAQAPAVAPRPRIAIVDEPTGAATAILDAVGALPFPVAVSVNVGDADLPDARWADLAQRRAPVWLVMNAPRSPEEIEPWRARVRVLVARRGDALTVLEIAVDRQPVAVARFAAQIAAIEAGVSHPAIRIALGGAAMDDPLRRADIYTADVAPYVDLLAVDARRAEDAATWLTSVDSQARLALGPAAGATGSVAGQEFFRETLADLGSSKEIRAWKPDDLSPARLRAMAPLATLLTHHIALIDDAGVRLSVLQNGRDVSASQGHMLAFDTDTFETYFAYWSNSAGDPLTLSVAVPGEGAPRLYDLDASTATPMAGAAVDASPGVMRFVLPLTGHSMVMAFNDGVKGFAERSGASAERPLSVAEIIVRHQREQRAQDAALDHYVAHARMEQHFRPTMADAGYDVVTESAYFAARDGVEWQEISFSVNGSKWGSDRPPFPLLQPEKVLALPLLLRFDAGYRYRLAGTARVGAFECYVVKFEPVREDSALYRGTVWIDRRTFARIRVQAVQSGLPAPVISNDETLDYTPAATIGDQAIFLFTKLTAKQILLVAGRNLLVEKQVVFSDFRVNAPDFDGLRAAARESDAIMYRETDGGLRYYIKQAGERVVSDRQTRDLRALAMGVTLDPSYGFPLPIFGINYLNFHFGSPNTQVAILFAGVLAAGNIQRSHLGAANLDASVDLFVIAAPSSDRLYGPAGEDPAVRLLTWPLSTGFNLGWQATAFQKFTAQYQFRFDGYVRDRTTAEDFASPSSTVTNGIGGAWDYKRAGYSLVTNAAWYYRSSWKPWGAGTVSSPSYVKYGAALSRDVYLDPFQKLHLNAAWLASSHVDRFGKYQFGMFDDTRIHGVPASGVRFGEVALARGTYSINIFEQYRVDVFLEHAWGRDRSGHGPWQWIPAVGLALNTRAPWDTILRVDVGKSVLPDYYRHLGSATAQIMLLKPLR